MSANKVLKYVVHYKESPDSPQWEETFFSKGAAEGHALRITLNGGIAVLVEELTDDIFIDPSKEKQDGQEADDL